MFSKIKLYLAAAMGAIALVIGIFVAGGKSATAKIKAKTQKKAHDVENMGNEAAYIGLKRAQEIRNEDIDTSKRDHFNS